MSETAAQRSARELFTKSALADVSRQEAGAFSSRTSTPWSVAERTGFEFPLPPAAGEGATAVVCTEPKDADAFAVCVSRPDEPARLREIVLVRYDELDGKAGEASRGRVDAAVRNALAGLRQSLAGRQA